MAKWYSPATLVNDGFGWDRALAAQFLGARAGETVSLMAARSQAAGRPFGCILCAILSVIVEHNHCPKTMTTGDGSTSQWASYRAGAALLALGLVIWAVLGVPWLLLGMLLR